VRQALNRPCVIDPFNPHPQPQDRQVKQLGINRLTTNAASIPDSFLLQTMRERIVQHHENLGQRSTTAQHAPISQPGIHFADEDVLRELPVDAGPAFFNFAFKQRLGARDIDTTHELFDQNNKRCAL